MNQQISSLIDQATNWIAKAQRILIGTGAGMSADSGIPTYRKAGELAWQRYGELEQWGLKAEDLSCPRLTDPSSRRSEGIKA